MAKREDRSAEIAQDVFDGMQLAEKEHRKNDIWDIVYIHPMPHKDGEIDTDIVIGDRHTKFEPFVAWYCYHGETKYLYYTGDYRQTFAQAYVCALQKIENEERMRKQ